MAIKKLTILHSNDIHGDFMAKPGENGLATGGVAMLSGYIEKCRKEGETLYFFAGDMFQGSLIDRDSKGTDTCLIMNQLEPDAMILGNHEVDYGLENLYQMRELYNFPIITSNLTLKDTNLTIFYPYRVIQMEDYKILVLGVTTNAILFQKDKKPELSHIEYHKPAEIIQSILKDLKDETYDLTVVLSHLGLADDHNLADALPKGSVDLIIGGHTHEDMDNPEYSEKHNVPIIQLADNTRHIGRFDLKIDTEKHCLAEPITNDSWKKIAINEKTSPVNEELESLVMILNKEVNDKYNTVISQLDHSIETDGNRFVESQIGDLFADALRQKLGVKIVAIGSGSLRQNTFDETVTLGNLRSMYAFDEPLFRITLKGSQLLHAMTTILRNASKNTDGRHGEYYQLSAECSFIYSPEEDRLTTATYKEKPIDKDAFYSVGIEWVHLSHIEEYWGLRLEDVLANDQKERISKDIFESLSKYFKKKQKKNITIVVPDPETEHRTGY